MADREDRLDRIVGDYCARRDRGEPVDPEEVCREHVDLADGLRARFAALKVIEGAYAEDECDEAPEALRTVGEYRIRREIGRGGMGVVYEAEQTSMRRRVALKVLSRGITTAPQAVKRFEREARAAGRLHHTNIVPIYGMGQDRGTWYYAMELVKGRSLGEIVAELRGRPEAPHSRMDFPDGSEDGRKPDRAENAGDGGNGRPTPRSRGSTGSVTRGRSTEKEVWPVPAERLSSTAKAMIR